MILQALHQLYARLQKDPTYGMARPGRSMQKISFRIVLRPDGRLFEIQPLAKSGNTAIQEEVLGTTKPSGPGFNPCFLWDNAGYMLGCQPEDKNPDRTRKSFEAFRDRHLAVENEIGTTSFFAVCRFLEQWQPENADQYPVLQDLTTGFGVFQIIGEQGYVHYDPLIQQWWDQYAQGVEKDESGELGQCLISGKDNMSIARLHPKIHGIPGGNPDKSLVGFKPDSFKSYGKDQSFNAPVGIDAAREYTAALNAILEGPRSSRHRFRLGDATVVFWTEKPTLLEDVFAEFAKHGSKLPESKEGEIQDIGLQKKIGTFLSALRQGIDEDSELAADEPGKTRFFLLGLSANSARLSVRFFHQSTIRELLERLRKHHRDSGIERQYGIKSKNPDPEWPSLGLLLRQTAREDKEIPPLLEGPLLDAVITGSVYPLGLVTAIIRRIRADRRVSYPRAFVIKGYLTRNLNKEITMSLDKNRNDPAYRLGRLFAALQKTQEDALSGVNASLRDRFYSSASATPRSVFPRLLRTYQHHLAKMEGGLKVNREKLVQEILDPIEDFPAHLDLAEQGLFAIGYYHQTNDFYRTQTNENQQN